MPLRFTWIFIIFVSLVMLIMIVSTRLIYNNDNSQTPPSVPNYVEIPQSPTNTPNTPTGIPANTQMQNNQTVIKGTTAQTPEAPKNLDAAEGNDFVTTNNIRNQNLKYYYYIPNRLLQNTAISYPVMVLVPEALKNGQAFTTQVFKDFAQKEGFVIIAPTFLFDEADYNSKSSYQYPEAWSGGALLSMVSNLQNKGIKPDKLYILGNSGGAQFALRFTMLHPDLVKACISHGSEEKIIPTAADSVKYFITVGTNDDNSIKDYANTFYSESKKFNMAVLYKEYNTGHELSAKQITDSLEFFRQAQFL